MSDISEFIQKLKKTQTKTQLKRYKKKKKKPSLKK